MNLISNDLNLIEDKINYMSKLFIIPLYFICANILIIYRYGLAGVFGIIATVLLSASGLFITIINAKILTRINVQKDQRVKLITEVIQGVKFIKTYAWELAFQSIINKVRALEIH